MAARTNGRRTRGGGRGRRERVGRRQKDATPTDPSDNSTAVHKTVRGFTNSEIKRLATSVIWDTHEVLFLIYH